MVPLRQSRLSRIRTNSLRNAFSLAPADGSSFARVWCGCAQKCREGVLFFMAAALARPDFYNGSEGVRAKTR
jgi:hypothetical protein